MSDSSTVTIHTDGASRGNPGAAAYAYVMEQPGQPAIEDADCLGRMTNNQAEYTALLRALEHALELFKDHPILVHSDSELMVKQLNGEYRVKNEELRPLFEEIQDLRKEFLRGVRIRHVRRAQNQRADALCNEALDGRRQSSRVSTGSSATPADALAVSLPSEPSTELREQVLDLLGIAAAAWSRGDRGNLTPEAVWEQLEAILREHGLLE